MTYVITHRSPTLPQSELPQEERDALGRYLSQTYQERVVRETNRKKAIIGKMKAALKGTLRQPTQPKN